MIKSKTFAVVGGGIGGLTTAIALQKKGFHVSVYESAPVFKPLGAGIVLAANAIKAFQTIGLEKEIVAAGNQLKRFVINDDGGTCLSSTVAEKVNQKFGLVSALALHRADLHEVLFRQLKPGTVINGKVCVGFVQSERDVTMHFADQSSVGVDYVIAADGIHSIFRKELISSSTLRYSGYTCWRAVASKVPEKFSNGVAAEIWGAGKRFGMVPLSNNRMYWYATQNAPASDSSLSSITVPDIQSGFRNFGSAVSEIISLTKDNELIRNDIFDFKPLDRYAYGNIVLTGDAAHATTPNLGQGACMAIEDAVVLANCVDKESDTVQAFRNFELRRLERNTRIVNTSYSLGKVAQIHNPILMALRNMAMRMVPEAVADRQLKFLYDVSFV